MKAVFFFFSVKISLTSESLQILISRNEKHYNVINLYKNVFQAEILKASFCRMDVKCNNTCTYT